MTPRISALYPWFWFHPLEINVFLGWWFTYPELKWRALCNPCCRYFSPVRSVNANFFFQCEEKIFFKNLQESSIHLVGSVNVRAYMWPTLWVYHHSHGELTVGDINRHWHVWGFFCTPSVLWFMPGSRSLMDATQGLLVGEAVCPLTCPTLFLQEHCPSIVRGVGNATAPQGFCDSQ